MPNFRNLMRTGEKQKSSAETADALLSCRMAYSDNRKELCKCLCFDGLRRKAAVKVSIR